MRRLALTTLALTSTIAALHGCSKEEKAKEAPPVMREHVSEGTPTGSLSVTVTFPSDAVKSVTNSVHVYVLNVDYVPRDGAVAHCGELVGRGIDPYSVALGRAADSVTKRTEENPNPFDTALSVTNVETGTAFVYVEAVDYGGQVEWAGCVDTSVTGATSATVTLSRAGVYDCNDPLTKDGSPCDDGLLCTVGEKCEGGECQGSIPRNCDALTDQCNAGTCDEARGCYPNPLINGTLCDDDNFCTINDACASGECTGQARDCAAEEPCAATAECIPGSAGFGYCNVLTWDPTGVVCDDGDPCTRGDTCYRYSSGLSGYCSGGPSCPGTNDPSGYCTGYCQYGTTAALNTCVYSAGSICNDGNSCTSNETCSSTGACGGGTVLTGNSCSDNDPCTTGETCSSTGTCSGGSATSCAGNAGSCYSTACDPVLGCSAPVAIGTQCTTAFYTCATYWGSTYASYNTHCNGSGSCLYTPLATGPGTAGCW